MTGSAPAPASAGAQSHDHTRAVLDARARELARPRSESGPDEDCLELVQFAVERQIIAIEARFVQAVVPAGDFTPVPGGAAHLAGILNFRGGIVPVFRLGVLIGAGPGESRHTIILGEHRIEFGLAVDSVDRALSLPLSRLQQAGWAQSPAGLLSRGMTAEAVTVLDGRALLCDPRFTVGTAMPDATQEERP